MININTDKVKIKDPLCGHLSNVVGSKKIAENVVSRLFFITIFQRI